MVLARKWRFARRQGLGIALALLVWTGIAAQSDDPGHFEVQAAHDELIDGTYYIDAQIYLRLSTEAANALHSGLPLTIRIEAEYLRRLRLWWDTTTAMASWRFQLTYHPITDRYVVLDTDSGSREAFKTLTDALQFIGHVDRLPVVAASEIEDDLRYDVRVRAVLDKTKFPGALALFAFARRDWSIASDWWQWRLDDE